MLHAPGLEDIGPGTDVVITDPDGTKVAAGSLDSGDSQKNRLRGVYDCVFRFSIPDVPGDLTLYTIIVGRRDELTYKRSELLLPVRLEIGR